MASKQVIKNVTINLNFSSCCRTSRFRYPGYPRTTSTFVKNILELLIASKEDENAVENNKFDQFLDCLSFIFQVDIDDILSFGFQYIIAVRKQTFQSINISWSEFQDCTKIQ